MYYMAAKLAPVTPIIGSGVREDESELSAEQLRSTDGDAAMRAAVAEAAQLARPGQTVLMAPAAASMDQVESYEHRGQAFIDAVAELMDSREDH